SARHNHRIGAHTCTNHTVPYGTALWGGDRGRDKVGFAPPSEPDCQISWIRLSSRWLTFKKIGMPQCVLVLRRTSPPRRSRYLAIGIDLFLWPGLFVSSAAGGCYATALAHTHRWTLKRAAHC